MMKKLSLLIFVFYYLVTSAQTPQFINYQGIVRDPLGGVLSNTTVNVEFRIYDNFTSGSPSYVESHNNTSTGPYGIIVLKMGQGVSTGTVSNINWATGDVSYEVYYNGSMVGSRERFASVPYAIKSTGGGAIPPGTKEGQTLRWSMAGNIWLPDSNLLNNGQRVSIGPYATTVKNKLRVIASSADSAAIFGYHPSAQANEAAIRGIATGFSAPSGSLTVDPVMGGHFVGYNFSGLGVGSIHYGVSTSGDAVGVVALGASSNTTSLLAGRSVGLYATAAGADSLKNFAAIFDKGRVVIKDSLMYLQPGNVGDVLTRMSSTGSVAWQPGGAGPWKRSMIGGIDNIYPLNNNDFVSIGMPAGLGANEKFHLHNTTGDAYMNLSTTNSSNNVGFVFGEASNWSKGVIAFDNLSNSLTYRLFGSRLMLIEGSSPHPIFFGKIPVGIASTSVFNIYDSVNVATTIRPILRVINTDPNLINPTGIYLGDNTNNGVSLSSRKLGTQTRFSIDNPSMSTQYHTFTDNSEYFPGSDGGAGKANIRGGFTTTSDISINASTNGNIVHNGYTQLGGNGAVIPAIQVIELSGTMPTTPGGSTTIGLGSYVSTPNKILSVSLLVDNGTRIVPPGYTLIAGYEYYFEIASGSPNILITATSSNSSSIVSQPFKALITFKK
jgi:hypothetical protein